MPKTFNARSFVQSRGKNKSYTLSVAGHKTKLVGLPKAFSATALAKLAAEQNVDLLGVSLPKDVSENKLVSGRGRVELTKKDMGEFIENGWNAAAEQDEVAAPPEVNGHANRIPATIS